MAKGVILEGVKDTYKILVSYNCQHDIEQHYNGESIYAVMGNYVTAKLARLVIKYGLEYGEGKKITLKEAGEIADDIIEKHGFIYLREKVSEALNSSLGMDENAEDVEESEGK